MRITFLFLVSDCLTCIVFAAPVPGFGVSTRGLVFSYALERRHNHLPEDDMKKTAALERERFDGQLAQQPRLVLTAHQLQTPTEITATMTVHDQPFHLHIQYIGQVHTLFHAPIYVVTSTPFRGHHVFALDSRQVDTSMQQHGNTIIGQANVGDIHYTIAAT